MKLLPTHKNIFIIQRSKTTELDVPDSAMVAGAFRGKVVETPDGIRFGDRKYGIGDAPPAENTIKVGAEVFFDASKAFRLSTSDGEFFAVKRKHILSEIIDG